MKPTGDALAMLPDHEPFAPPIGMLAGNGGFPADIARSIRARGGDVVVLGIDGEASSALDEFGLVRVGWGEVGRILRTFRNRGCREIVIVGGVTRPDLARIRPDRGLLWNLPKLIGIVLSGGDDGVLRALVRLVEEKGFTVVSPADVAPEIVAGAGAMGCAEPSSADIEDILLGSSIVKTLGPFDVGQGVIVSGGTVEAIEAAEGTNGMIERVAARRAGAGCLQAGGGRFGVLVKRPKPGQEMRIDLPAIGPETVERVAAAGLKGIAVLAGQTLVTGRAEVERRARDAGLFVYGFTDGQDRSGATRQTPASGVPARTLSKIRPDRTALGDARFGAAALARLAEGCPAAVAVVRRGHVLAVEPCDAVEDLFARVARHTQWGERRLGRRGGVAVFGRAGHVDEKACAAAAASRLAGIALTGPHAHAAAAALASAADAAGLFLIALDQDGGGA